MLEWAHYSTSHALHHSLKQVGNDWFLLANDFADYLKAQEEVDRVYKDQSEWNRRWVEG